MYIRGPCIHFFVVPHNLGMDHTVLPANNTMPAFTS